jgi:hypothetical protein
MTNPGPSWTVAHPQKWEYITRTTGSNRDDGWPLMMKAANDLGQEGWEMVGFQLSHGTAYFNNYVKAFFKRPLV